ncbi:MAG: hypothetical protein NVS1B13_25670 [Flavisolibacter sp.]
MQKIVPLKLEELKNLRKKYIQELKNQSRQVSSIDKIGLWITKNVGSMRFFGIVFIWTLLWLTWNILVPKIYRFDPYPGFVFWLFISNMIQLFLMPLIMIGQNLQSRHSDLRADTDLKINELAALENETILIHLENQNEIILKILNHIDPTTQAAKEKLK